MRSAHRRWHLMSIAARRWSNASAIVLAAMVLVIAAVAFVAVELREARRVLLADGARATERLAWLLAEGAAEAVETIDLTLGAIAEAVEAAPPLPKHSPAFEDAMRAKLAALPYVRALFVIGPDGRLTQDTDRDTPDLSLADRGYFKAHQQDPALGLYIGPPLLSRSVGVWFVSMSRRIRGPGGAFGGIAVAAVEPRYFQRLYRGIDLSDGSLIELWLRDGVMVARHPHHEAAVGRAFPGHEVFARLLPRSPAGTLRAASPLDGARRVTSYRTVPKAPLVVLVGLPEAQLLAPWRRQAGVLVGGAATFALLVGATAWLALERQERERVTRARLGQVSRHEVIVRQTGRIASDLATVAMALLANLVLLKRRTEQADSLRLVETAERAARRVEALTAQLQDIARKPSPSDEVVSLNDAVADVERLVGELAGDQRFVETTLDATLPPCRVDRLKLESALLDLALRVRQRALPGGEIAIRTERVDVRSPEADRLPAGLCAQLVITVNARGAPPGTSERVREEVSTTGPAAGEIGLGLEDLDTLVRKSGGCMATEGGPGGAVSVHLYFPAAAAPGERAAA